MSQTNSEPDAMTNWMDGMIKLKHEAIEKKDYDMYKWALTEAQKDFSKMFSEAEMEETINLLTDMLKMITSELRWVKQKEAEKSIPF